MIIFFCHKKEFLAYTGIPLKYFKYEYILLNDFDDYYFKKACVIIPIGISAQIKLNEYSKYKHKFLSSYIKHSLYENNNQIHIQDVEKQLKDVIKNIVKRFSYSGLMEIEFIHSTDGTIYLMECNPRVSSNMLCMEEDKTVPFNEVLFYPY